MTAHTPEGTDTTDSGPIDRRALESGAMAQQMTSDPGPVDIRALAVAAATRAGLYLPGKSTTEDAVGACVVVEGLTEKILKLTINDGGDTRLGSTIEYTDAVFDRDGKEIGTSTSSAVVLGMAPHMWQFHRSTVELDDGGFESTGVIDATAMLRGMTQILQVAGTSGRYAGKSGYLTIAIADPTRKPPHYTTSFAVC